MSLSVTIEAEELRNPVLALYLDGSCLIRVGPDGDILVNGRPASPRRIAEALRRWAVNNGEDLTPG